MFINNLDVIYPVSLSVRTVGFHPTRSGSIPLRDTILKHIFPSWDSLLLGLERTAVREMQLQYCSKYVLIWFYEVSGTWECLGWL